MDLFPSQVVDAEHVERLPSQPDVQTVLTNFMWSLCAFLVHLQDDTIQFVRLAWNERFQRHFIDTAAYIHELESITVRSWSWSARKLRSALPQNDAGNTDVRTCFVWRENFFLVKCRFTFGQRTVAPGTVHFLQIGAVDMKLYFIDTRYRFEEMTVREAIFPIQEQENYTSRTLLANHCYYIPAHTIYLIYATNKSFFSIHVLSSDAALPFRATNPITHVFGRRSVLNLNRPRNEIEPCTSTTREEEHSGTEEEERDGKRIKLEEAFKIISPDFKDWYQKNFKHNFRRTVYVETIQRKCLDESGAGNEVVIVE